MLRTIFHHVANDEDDFAHCFGRPTDCYCEPEVDDLGTDYVGIEHRLIKHQDMTGRAKEAMYG
jgi:hypothetical protein